jgi:hypothetical protein
MAEVRIADNSERGKVLNATTPALNVAYLEFGAEAAPPVVLLHGWPYDVEKSQKRFGFVQTYDEKSRQRLFEVLKPQGMAMNQQVTFLSDGGATCGRCSSI